MRKKAFELFICAVIVLYIFLVYARMRDDRSADSRTVILTNDLAKV